MPEDRRGRGCWPSASPDAALSRRFALGAEAVSAVRSVMVCGSWVFLFSLAAPPLLCKSEVPQYKQCLKRRINVP